MSDYLWDKTGEEDAEVERLEELLGAFRHQPRPLDLPAEAVPSSPPHAATLLRPRRFNAALLAAAAALLLMVLAGALVMLRQNGVDGGQQAESRDSKNEPAKKDAAPREESIPPAEPEKRVERAAGDVAPDRKSVQTNAHTPALGKRSGGVLPERAAGLTSQWREDRILEIPLRPNRNLFAIALASEPRRVPEPEKSAPPPGVEGQAAKEQLVYALRLASAKLNEVQKMTRGEDAPHAFTERNRTR